MDHEIVIEAGETDRNYWRDLFRYRDLFYFLAWRDVLVRCSRSNASSRRKRSDRRHGKSVPEEAGVALDEFCRVAEDFSARKIIGRFSTLLEHVKPSQTGVRVTRFNAFFHWAVPARREVEAGGEVGRHHLLTHCYWREAGPEFKNVNIMAVAHGTDKAHRKASRLQQK